MLGLGLSVGLALMATIGAITTPRKRKVESPVWARELERNLEVMNFQMQVWEQAREEAI